MRTFASVEEAFGALDADDADRRAAAIACLGESRYAPAVPKLTALLRAADPGTRFLAAKALGQIGDEAESALPALFDALRDTDMFLRAGVTGALDQDRLIRLCRV